MTPDPGPQLKELEKLGPKLKGIGDCQARHTSCAFNHIRNVVSQSVKEVLQSLVDDGLVQYDKIGASNCRFLRSAYTRISGR
jgi:hypothetical protein